MEADGGQGTGVTVEPLPPERLQEARTLLLDLLMAEQDHFDHPRQSRADLDRGLPPATPSFVGENHVLVGRAGGRIVGICWCVLHDPGTGLEAEIAELYVVPDCRRRGVAGGLVGEAIRLFETRGVTFACVWTRPDNRPALHLYETHGFGPTVQAVLTWYPKEARA
ncbi:MAG TPA: GNAT family N-acetyltransferase [Candidatus Micrarchaeia archaeon]|nr:GNAT family N-acetyltransferase [Candidatus Micrarchaeia archaeon]